MFKSFTESDNGTIIIHLEGTILIDNASDIQKTFIAAFEKQQPVVLELSKVTECDTSIIQLVSSFCYSLCSSGQSLGFKNDSISEDVISVITSTGFHFRSTCTRIKNVNCILKKVGGTVQKNQEPYR